MWTVAPFSVKRPQAVLFAAWLMPGPQAEIGGRAGLVGIVEGGGRIRCEVFVVGKGVGGERIVCALADCAVAGAECASNGTLLIVGIPKL